MGFQNPSIPPYATHRKAFALFVESRPSSALTTTTALDKFVDFCATAATLDWDFLRTTQNDSGPRRVTYTDTNNEKGTYFWSYGARW